MSHPPQKPNDLLLHFRSGVADIAWPPMAIGEAAPLVAMVQYLDKSQWLPREELEAQQYKQLAVLATYLNQHSLQFRERLEQAGLRAEGLASPENFRKLPLLTRRDVQQAGELFYCREIPHLHLPHKKAHTSGSTGEPVTVVKTAITALFWQAMTLREHAWHQRDFMGNVLIIQSSDVGNYVRQNGWGKPVSLLFESGEVRSMPIKTDIKRQVEEIVEFKPHHLLIYPSNLKAIITYCERNNIVVSSIKHIWCRAETLSPELRKKAAEFFGATLEDNYCSEEMGIMAMQCPQSGLYHVMSENIILEVLDDNGKPCAEGEVGKVVTTDIHNFTTPLVRYVTGDYAEMGGACPCGRGLPVIRNIRGRERNLVANPDGTRHWPRLAIEHYEHIELILQYQFIQHSLQDIELRLVTRRKLTEAEELEFIDHLQRSMGHPFRFRLNYFEGRLPLSARDKFEEFISHVV